VGQGLSFFHNEQVAIPRNPTRKRGMELKTRSSFAYASGYDSLYLLQVEKAKSPGAWEQSRKTGALSENAQLTIA